MDSTSKRGRAIRILTRRLMAADEWRRYMANATGPRGEIVVDRQMMDIVVKVVLADGQAWKLLRQLRSHLERFGLTRDEALARIAEMTRHDRARDDVPPRDLAIAQTAERYGRESVRRALGMSAASVRSAVERAKKRHR